MDDKDDEISIDFSKIKNFFKKKEKNVELDKKDTHSDDTQENQEYTQSVKHEKSIENQKTSKSSIEEENDDIEFDFSKIKAFFKSGGDKEDKSADPKTGGEITKKVVDDKKMSPSEDDDEISFDFKKIKAFFKSRKEKFHDDAKVDREDELNFDWDATKKFMVKYSIFFLLLIPIFFSIFFRVQSAYLPITDVWASSSVENYYINQIKDQIDRQYPNLPDSNKNALVDQEFRKLLSQNKDMVDQQIKQSSEFFKSHLRNEKGQTYLLEIDPYFWMRNAKNVIDHGYPGDEIRDGKEIDNHMFAPLGRVVPYDMFHAYFEAYYYKFIRFFNRDADLMAVAFYLPIILSTLSVIPAFFIARRVAGNFAGLMASLMIAIHPAFLTRTMGGFADTDAYNILFPLMISWLFLEAFESNKFSKSFIFSILAGLLVGFYSFAWGGWWYIFDFILASSFIFIIYEIMIYRKEFAKGLKHFILQSFIKNTSISVITFFISSTIFILFFSGYNIFMIFLKGPGFFARLKEVAITTVWPNVYTTVAEQNPASFSSIVSQMGGKFLIALAILGVLLCLLKKDKNNKVDIKYFILFAIWMIGTFYASIKGVRFSLLLVPVFGLAIGVALGTALNYVSRWTTNYLNINKTVSSIVLGVLLMTTLINPFVSAKNTSLYEIPSMNDAWFNSLDKIRIESKPDAIINSWWDFGHWFKTIGDRAVTFDGTSQNTPMAHWIGKVLLTSDEKTAVGILRMLDCGSNNAFNELNQKINDTPRSIDILYEIIIEDKNNASIILDKYGLNDEQKENILKNTHCVPPENYFITSEDMVGKSGVWSHFGSWDFDRALMYNKLRASGGIENKDIAISFLKARFNLSDEQADNIYFEVQGIKDSSEANSWIAPWPSFASGMNGCKNVDRANIKCNIGQGGEANINLETLEANIPTPQKTFHPNSLVLVGETGLTIKEFNDSDSLLGFSISLMPNGDSYDAIILSPQLASSMFTRMFYMEGHGLRYFDKFSDERSIFGGRIIVWKVDWDGKDENIAQVFIKPLDNINNTLSNSSLEIIPSSDNNDTMDNKSKEDSKSMGSSNIKTVTNNLTVENDESIAEETKINNSFN